MATGTHLDIVHLLFEPVVTVGAAAFTHAMARPVSLRPAGWALGAVAASFLVHRGVQALVGDVDLISASIAGKSALTAVLLDYAGSAVVFLATGPIVYALTSRRRPILDGERG